MLKLFQTRRAAWLSLVLLGAGCATAPGDRDLTARIVDEATRATGGVDAARAIPALEYRLRITEPTYRARAIYLVDRHGDMRIDVYIDGNRVYTECLHDGTAWQMGRDGVAKPESAQGTAALRRGTQFPGQILALAELPAHGHRVAYAGRQIIDGKDYEVLRLTMRDGFVSYRFIDPRTRLIARSRDASALHPDADAATHASETTWSDYRRVDGVLRAFRSVRTDLRSGHWKQTVQVESVRRLAKLPDALLLESGSLREADRR